MSGRSVGRVALVLLIAASAAHAAPTPEQKCQARKNLAAGKYSLCRQNAVKTLILNADAVKYTTALGACATGLSEAWQKADQKAADAAAACPDAPLSLAQIQSALDAQTDNIAGALGGAALRPPVLFLKTGNTECDQGGGTLGPCPGSPLGQDGDFQRGIAPSLADNGDGTITDNQTGLMWEKLSYDGSVHDFQPVYTWSSGFAKITVLNTASFAGHTDWRMPNINELHSLSRYVLEGIDPVFLSNCTLGCTVLTCSCGGFSAWSSTSRADDPSAWVLSGGRLSASATNKTDGALSSVRAVRLGF